MICEEAGVKTILGRSTIIVLGVYRPHGNLVTVMDVISDVLEVTSAVNHPTILLGDFNIDCLAKRNDYLLMNNTLKSHNIHRIELPPSRVTPTSQSSIAAVSAFLARQCSCRRKKGRLVDWKSKREVIGLELKK
ncbi:hypothetical protein J6590_102242 [Homalodisca vitripennis]|nr:hypothetical protein J6590_102242 [Homalodisca vitripennis]